ncbi:MAG: DUF3500 domain-containing protein [Bryobacteraceae bacterium]
MHIPRRSFLSSSATALGGGLLAARGIHAAQQDVHAAMPGAPHAHAHAAPLMVECANRFLAALEPDQRAKASIPFDGDERLTWYYVPHDRNGLPLREMSGYQKLLAGALLASGLSQTGYIKAVSIMSLDEVLRIMENGTGPRRDAEGYFFSVFGTPSAEGVWGYRVDGHHVSQNFTVVNGQVVDGPSFFGANPAEVRQGPRTGLRVLAREDDLGFEVIRACDEPQQKVAIVDPVAYHDILTTNSRKAALEGQPSGLSASKMAAKQFDALRALVEEYAGNVAPELADARLAQLNQAGRNIYFAWAGGINRGDPHYYRVQTPAFLIEFDETQDHANHIHSVWRDFNGDFGMDLLQAHYDSSHAKK